MGLATRHAVLGAALLVSSQLAAVPAAAQLAVGAPAPDFELIDTDDVARSLGDYKDEVRVLFFVGWG